MADMIIPDPTDKDPIWDIYRTFPIIDAINDGTIYHHQWQKIIDALNLLMAQTTGSAIPGGNVLSIVDVTGTLYQMLPNDNVVLVKASAPTTILLPNTLTALNAGRIVNIKDTLGNSEQFPITITPGAGHYIDSPAGPNQNTDLDVSGNMVIEENFASIQMIWTGTFWNII